jgi:hypothetical protein
MAITLGHTDLNFSAPTEAVTPSKDKIFSVVSY